MGLKEQRSGSKAEPHPEDCWQQGVLGLGLMDEHRGGCTLLPAAVLIFASEQKIRP